MIIFQSDSGGFTLLEVLISMVILGLMAATVFGGLRLGTRASERGEYEAQRLQHLRIVTEILSSQIRSAFPYSLYKPPKPGQAQSEVSDEEQELLKKKGPPVFFEGKSNEVQFVSLNALDPSLNGLVRVKYELEENGDESSLTAREDFVRGIDSLRREPDIEASPLLGEVGSIQFDYFGKVVEDKEPVWSKEWSGRTIRRLPMGIRIRMVFENDRSYPLDWIVWIPSEPKSATAGTRTTLPFINVLGR